MARSTRRDRKKEAYWQRMVREQAGSGLSVRAWCRKHDARESAFYWWRAQLAQRDAAAPPFVPVRVTAESSTIASPGRIEILLASDRRVHVVGPVDRQTLRDVLTVLAEHASVAEARGC